MGLASEISEIRVLLPAFGYPTRPTSARSFSRNRSTRCSPGSQAQTSRRAVRRRRERRVSSTSSSAARDEHAISDVAQVRERNQFIAMLVVDDGPRRNLEFHVCAAITGAVGAQTVLAALRIEFWMETVRDERVLVLAGDEVDRSARAAVPAVRAAARYAHLPAEGHAAVAAIARVDLNVYFVDEHGEGIPAGLLLVEGKNADLAAMRAVIGKLHLARHLRKQRVVFAPAHVQSRLEAASALADEDRAAWDDVAVVALDAEPLRIAVAAVS